MKRRPLKPEHQAAIDRLHTALRHVEHSLYADVYKGRLAVLVTYTDWLPEGKALPIVRTAIPDAAHVTVKRELSEQTIKQLLYEEWKRNRVCVVDADSRLHTFRELVYDVADGSTAYHVLPPIGA